MGQSQQNSIWFGTGYVCLPVMHNTKTSCKLWKMGNVRPFLFCIAILPLNSKDIHATALSGEQALLHTQHAPQQPANKGTQPQSPRPKNKHGFWQLYSSSLWQNSLQTKGAVQYFWWPSVLIFDTWPILSPFVEMYREKKKRSTQMLPIKDTLLQALLFHHRPGFKANQVSLRASPLSGVLVRTTEELWLYTRLLGPPPWKWTAYNHILLINPFLNSPCNLHIA